MAYQGKSIEDIMKGVTAFQQTAKNQAGAAGGAQTPDSSGTNAQRQQGGLNTAKPKVGQTQAPFGAMPSENNTLSTYNPDMGGKTIVQRAQEFSESRRARSPLRRQTPAAPSPFQQRKMDKERQRMYDNILGQAGAGPNKDISLKNALGIIAQMEGDRIGAETTRRGQDVGAESTDLQLQTQQEIASNRDRVNQRLGELDATTRTEQMRNTAQMQEQKLGQQQTQFEQEMQFKGKELEATKEGRAIQAGTDLKVGALGLEREELKARMSGLKAATGKDVLGEPMFNRDMAIEILMEAGLDPLDYFGE